VSDGTRDQRREQITKAVVDITAEGGLQAATFRTVAERAGVSVRLVQYYFGDKDQLLADTLAFVRADVADLVATGLAALGDDAEPRQVLETICEAFLPADERRRRAMLVFIAFGTAALTDESLRAPDALRRGRELAEVIAEQLRCERSDDHVDDDALLLVMTIVGLGNGVLAGDVTLDHARRLLDHALDRALTGV
jgi:TetR/AcrR family transcriptional regulator, transcriptional repressor of bet genes